MTRTNPGRVPMVLGRVASRASTAIVGAVAGGALVACSTPAGPSAATPSVLDPGEAVGSAQFFGVDFRPCSDIELEGYPQSLEQASRDYYEGPWCGLRGNERIYLWTYARPLTPGQSPESVRGDVLADGQQMVFELVAQGYERVCGSAPPDGPVDAGYERAENPSRVRVVTAGSLAQPSAAADGGQADEDQEASPLPVVDQPLSLQVVFSPSQRDTGVPEGAPAPPC